MTAPPRFARAALSLWAAMAAFSAARVSAGPRILSLDQCADQYVLAIAPRVDIVALSRRATQADSYLREQASGLPQIRADLEAVLAARPTIVVRWWGGDPSLLTTLRRRRIPVVSLEDASSFAEVRSNVRRVAAALGRSSAGEGLIAGMDRQLAAAAHAAAHAGALYITPSGETAGRGTLVDSILRSAGYANLETSWGFRSVPLESLVLHPPAAVVAGFFDSDLSAQRWSEGRRDFLRGLVARRTIVSLPAAVLACPAWFAGDAVARLAEAARGR